MELVAYDDQMRMKNAATRQLHHGDDRNQKFGTPFSNLKRKDDDRI